LEQILFFGDVHFWLSQVSAQPPVGKIGFVSSVNRFGKSWFSFGQQAFESISFWLVLVGHSWLSVIWRFGRVEVDKTL